MKKLKEDSLEDYSSELSDVYHFAKAKHDATGAIRKNSGLPYFVHPEMVAEVVAAYGGTDAQIEAALLHDTVEDTDTTAEELERLYGPEVAQIVEEITNYKPDVEYYGKEDYINHELVELSDEALLVKVADCVCNYLDSPKPGQAERLVRNLKYLIEFRPNLPDGVRRLLKSIPPLNDVYDLDKDEFDEPYIDDEEGYQRIVASKKTDKARRVQEGFHGHTFKINWEMLDQEGSDRLTDLLINAVAWKNEDEDYKTQEKFELTFNRKFEELKKRGMSSNEAAPKASNYALFTIFPRDDEEASNIINDYLFSGACRDEEDENLLRSFVSDEGEETNSSQGLPTDKYDLGPWTDPAYESRKRNKKVIKEMARVDNFDLSPYDLRNQIKSYVRGRLYDLVGPDGAMNFKINQPKWDMIYNGAQGGACFAIKTQGEDYYMSTFLNSSLNWQGKGFEEFKEDFEDMVNTAFSNKSQIKESYADMVETFEEFVASKKLSPENKNYLKDLLQKEEGIDFKEGDNTKIRLSVLDRAYEHLRMDNVDRSYFNK